MATATMSATLMDRCSCAEGGECWHFAAGYEWCRPCQEHHRPPECAINDHGEALAACGCTWAETEEPGYYDQPCRHELEYATREHARRSPYGRPRTSVA